KTHFSHASPSSVGKASRPAPGRQSSLYFLLLPRARSAGYFLSSLSFSVAWAAATGSTGQLDQVEQNGSDLGGDRFGVLRWQRAALLLGHPLEVLEQLGGFHVTGWTGAATRGLRA